MNTSDLVQSRHLDRRAAIYIRQSTPQQVLTNTESQRIQYTLNERANQLGWPEHQIDTIDTDLGKTAATTEGRQGFQEIVAQVALGKIGILIAYDATRLARNCSHWYQLLDLCARHDCLIADRDGVYDPSEINGRLLLGLKGQISELELHTIRARLTAGIESKAKRGELDLILPTGLVRLETGKVMKHPNVEVVERIDLVFQTLLEKRTLSKAVRWFNQNDLKIPRSTRQGDIQWKPANTGSIYAMARNPAYAGAFVYGKTRLVTCSTTGKRTQVRRPIEEWRFVVHDKYPAFISWETFEKIDQMLKDNYSTYEKVATRGLPREGKALLQGIVYCGECGHKMAMQYARGSTYICHHLYEKHDADVCQHIRSEPIDSQVVEWFFEALSVTEIDAAAKALHVIDSERERTLKAREQQVQRLRYQAQLAERQFNKSDPDNRLVTGELERRWEFALRQLKTAEESLERGKEQTCAYTIPADLLEMLKDIGPRLPEVWTSDLLRPAQKKALLRSLIDKVVLRRIHLDTFDVRVVWRGGANTRGEVLVHAGHFAKMSQAKEMESEILRLAREGVSDKEIAEALTAQGFRSPRRPHVTKKLVTRIRQKNRVYRRPSQCLPVSVEGFLTAPQIAKQLGVPPEWIYYRIKMGKIEAKKDASTDCWVFPDKPETLQQFRQLYEGKVDHIRP